MIAWLYKLIIGNFSHCKHKWQINQEYDVFQGETKGLPIRKGYILQCEKCGDIKSVRTV